MAIEITSQEQLAQVYYSTITGLNPNIVPDIKGTDPYFKANATSQIGANVIQDIQLFQNNIFAASSSGVYLDKHAGDLGMTPRQGALPAQGTATLQGMFTTGAAYTITVGTLLTSTLTNNQYQVVEQVTIPISTVIDTVVIQIQSTSTGSGTASPANDILTFTTPLNIFTNQVVTTCQIPASGMNAGSDIESDPQFAQRIFDFSQNPRGGGGSGDYIKWCFLGSSNVTQASVITTPLGNNDILFPTIFTGNPNPNYYIDGSAANGFQPTAAPINRTAINSDITAVQTYIDGVRPANDNPNVITVVTYELSQTDSIFGNGSYFDVNVALSPGVDLTTTIETPYTGLLTVAELIQREFRRAIISTPAGGTEINTGSDMSPVYGQYILVSDIQNTILEGLANSNNFQGNYYSLIVSIQISYHAQGSGTSTYLVPVPSLQNGFLFETIDGNYFAYYVYDIDVAMINIATESS